MSEAWVVNASPLILFSRIGRLDLIERLAQTILVPDAVIEEVRAGHHKDPKAATALDWAEQYRVENVTVAASIEHWDLGSGESQVIAHSVAPRWAVLDDRAARRCAAAHEYRSSDRSASSSARRRSGTSIMRAPSSKG